MSESWQPIASIANLTKRSELLHQIREFFFDRDVKEVQTPVLSANTVSDPHIESVAVPGHGFLQTSPEYLMKRLLAAGMPSCYQLGSVFRASEQGRWHSTEFTMLEWYRLGFTLEDLMRETADLVNAILNRQLEYETQSFGELVYEAFGLDPYLPDSEEIQKKASKFGFDGSQDWEEALDFLVTQAIGKLPNPAVFIVDYPDHLSALARVTEDGNRKIAKRFELIVDGLEIANGYDELRDAEELLRRIESDNQSRQASGKPTIEVDSDLHAAMQTGLPPCCGVALGVDRLLALTVGAKSVSEVLAFQI